MPPFVLRFDEVDRAQIALVGGKGAHLGELTRIEGVRVPSGFCVTTEAYQRLVGQSEAIRERLERLALLGADDAAGLRALSAEIRRSIEATPIPDDVAAEITDALDRLGQGVACAVRSSATAEDLPTASFAGQQDTYLNVAGPGAVLDHVRRCWASLFTDRAVTYRLKNGFDPGKVRMAVVVQRMIFPEASGVLFTADPLSGNRKVASVEAIFGLGEVLVSGRVNADVFKVRYGAVVDRSIGGKRIALQPSPEGGTRPVEVPPARREQPALTEEQVLRLVALGRRIEGHFGTPQDIEWCLADDEFHIVQSRPITTLFPIPATSDGENRVYISVGHQQMMTDPIKPLGISFWQLTAGRPMHEAGARLFVDVTALVASPGSRDGFLQMMGRSDPLMRDALQTLLDRGDFIRELPAEAPAPPPPVAPAQPTETDPSLVDELIARTEASVAALRREIGEKTGAELIEFIMEDIQELRRILQSPESHQAVMIGIEAAWWLNEKLEEWLGERGAADTLSQSVRNNVTSEMGLALLDVADAIRPYPEVVAFVQGIEGEEDFLDGLPRVTGGREARDAISRWLDRYGMRCPGEIDITRPRWSERPTTLVPLILSHLRSLEPGESTRRFERGLLEARQKEQEVIERLRAQPDGERKAAEARRMIERLRSFIGYREYPKYGMICRYSVYRQALLEEAGRLVRAGVLGEEEDIYYLTVQELLEVARSRRADAGLIARRKEEFRAAQALTPPRVLTSEGEVISGVYRREGIPAGALIGLPVSAGSVEGRARVLVEMTGAELEPGDILVTAYTDPSWTPLFLAVAGLVTEVGGLMTHGAVIAREYGLPAVVGVERATERIRDGQRIRVHGTEGYVETLD